MIIQTQKALGRQPRSVRLIIGILALGGCTASAAPRLDEACEQAFDRRVALEVMAFEGAETKHEQQRILEGTRAYVVERCVARGDVDAARCATAADSLRAAAACTAAPTVAASVAP